MEGLWRTFVVVIVLALLGVIFTHSDTLIDSGIFLDHRIDTYPPYYTFSNQSIIINISGFDINPSTFSCNATVDSQHFPLTYDSARQDFTGNMSFNISGEFILDFVCSNGTLSDNTGGNVYRQTFLPNSDLNWWNELEQGKYKISGMKITFYINYSTEPYGLPIPNAHCTYNFSHDGLNGSAIADGNLYSFSRSFDAPGSYSYNITCDHQNHSIRRSAAAISIIEIPPMFTRTYTSMQGFYTATSFVGNLSNEELDIMYTGYGTAEDTKWYKPNQGYTERVDPGFLNGLIDGAGVFADFDRDGDYDTLLCGKKSSEFTRYYTQGLVDFSHIPTVLENVTHCSIATADLNIDGNQNIILSGSSASLPYAAVYRNEDGIFTLENTLEGLRYSSTAVLDSNNDGIDDFYMMGSPDGVNSKSYLYLYNGSELTQVNMTYNLSNGIALVGDINADAQDDLIVIGRNRSSIAGSTYGVVYLNNGTGLEHHQSLTGLTGYSTARPGGALGDVDNDGDLDLIIAGRDYSENPTSILYLNNGTHVLPSQEYIMPFNEVSINIFDIDSDGDLDIFAVGYNETIGTAAILKNNFSLNKTNTPYSTPYN